MRFYRLLVCIFLASCGGPGNGPDKPDPAADSAVVDVAGLSLPDRLAELQDSAGTHDADAVRLEIDISESRGDVPAEWTTGCGPAGEKSCSVDGLTVLVCSETREWVDFETCAAPRGCGEGRCVLCHGVLGTHSNQEFEVEGEPRHYFLHIPASYDCSGEPAGLLIDLHGTAGDDFGHPEEAYRTTELKALADGENFIAVRPRSYSHEWGGYNIYQWDTSPSDIQKNSQFVAALAQWLVDSYHVDENRIYLSGFSSGTNQVSEVMSSEPELFSGFAFIGGGTWTLDEIGADLSARRLYMQTGYRDYMMVYRDQLLGLVSELALPEGQLLIRGNNSGHDLYGWHFDELWDWLDKGEEAEEGELAPGWEPEELTTEADLLTAASVGGTVVACGEGGRCFIRDESGWLEAERSEGWEISALTGLCFRDDGEGMAVGGGSFATTVDFGHSWEDRGTLPGLDGSLLGYTHGNGVACLADGTIMVVGYWSVMTTADMGTEWEGIYAKAGWESSPQAAAVMTVNGQALTTGFSYVGLYQGGDTMEQVGGGLGLPPFNDWFLGGWILDEAWVIVGDAGRILRADTSGDKPKWAVPFAHGPDLFAVSFHDDQKGAAVGDHGRVLVTTDSGETWADLSSGTPAFLSAVVWLGENELLVMGEKGAALRHIFD